MPTAHPAPGGRGAPAPAFAAPRAAAAPAAAAASAVVPASSAAANPAALSAVQPASPAPLPVAAVPAVRAVNVRAAPPPAELDEEDADTQLFAEEGPAGGCASGECLPEPGPEEAAAEAPSAVAAVRPSRDSPTQALAERWRAAVDTVRAASARHGASLAFGRLLWIRPGEVGVAYPAAMGFHRTTVTASAGRSIVERALSEHFGRPTRLVVEQAVDGVGATLSVAEEDQQNRTAHERSTEGKVRGHPAVRAALKILGGEIEHIQVLEPARPPPPAPDVLEQGTDEGSSEGSSEGS